MNHAEGFLNLMQTRVSSAPVVAVLASIRSVNLFEMPERGVRA